MSFLDKMFNKNPKEGLEEEKNNLETSSEDPLETPVDAVAEAEAEKKKGMLEKFKGYLAKLEGMAMELANVDSEKAAENLAKNENLRNNLKVAGGILTTLGFGAAMVLAFTESFHVTEILQNVKPLVNELMMGVTFVATALAGAMTHEAIDNNRKFAAATERISQESSSEDNVAGDVSGGVAA